MAINGIKIIEKPKYSIFYIESLSDELKEIIRVQLKGIWNGFAEADSLPRFYSYKNTLTEFIDRYNSKSSNIKKGMIGELIARCAFYDKKQVKTVKFL